MVILVKVNVREAVVDDAPAIALVHVDGWRAAYSGILPEAFLAELSVEARANAWRGFIGQPREGARFFVAEAPDVVGFASVGPSRDEQGVGEVYAIYASPTHWSAGIGRALMEQAVTALHGFEAATLWVLAENVRARRFYERAGWHADGGAKDVDIGGRVVTEVRYRIALR